MMKKARLFLIGLFAAFLPVLMAPTGGIPSTPTFQSVRVQNGVRPTIPTTVDGIYTAGSTGETIQVDHLAGVDSKIWSSYVDSSGNWILRAVSDNYGSALNAIVCSRSGVASNSCVINGIASTSTGTATLTATGGTTAPNSTLTWTVSGNIGCARLSTLTMTSNATSFTLTGVPAAMTPATQVSNISIPGLQDNSANNFTGATVSALTNNTYAFALSGTGTFTASGSKGIPFILSFCYPLK